MSTPNYADTLGSMLIGTLFSFALWGVACIQTYEYYQDNKDSVFQRCVVAFLWTVDTLSAAMTAHMSYYYMVSNYTNPSAITKQIWSLNLTSAVGGILNLVIRTMFAWRIYQFSGKNILLTAWVMLVTVADFVLAVFASAKLFGGDTSQETITHILYGSFALGVAADLSVALALCWYLYSPTTGFRRPDSIVNTVLVYVVNTGLLVTIDAIVGMITFIVVKNNRVFFIFFVIASKLYVNAYLASVNARTRMKAAESRVPLSGISSSSRRRTTGEKITDPTMATISLQEQTEDETDDTKFSRGV